MDQSRFNFLKKLATHFRENPEATSFDGISKENCLSLLALHFSTPEEILDPTARDFFLKLEEKINLFEQRFRQNQLPPPIVPLPQKVQELSQQWQSESEKKEISPSYQIRLGKNFENQLRKQSRKAWRQLGPKGKSKIIALLGRFKFLGKLVKLGGKALGPIGIAITALLSPKLLKRILKIVLGAILLNLYLLLALLGMGALIGGAIGALIGGIIAGPAGAAIGFAAGVAAGSAIEHWFVRPAINTWTGAGNFLTGAGNFLGGLWSGFWTGAGNMLSGALSWAGGALEATGGFLSGLGAQFAGISFPTLSTVTIPVIGSISLVGITTLWVGTSVVGTSFMREPAPVPASLPPPQSYISLVKFATPSSLDNTEVEGAGKDITFTITISAPKAKLTNIRITDQIVKISGSTSVGINIDKNGEPLGPWLIAEIGQNQAETKTFQILADSSFKDSTLVNTVNVLADVLSEGKVDQAASFTINVFIGSRPIAGSCGICNPIFNKNIEWPKLLAEAATAYLVPGSFLAGISLIESGVPWGFTDAQVLMYSAPGPGMPPPPGICPVNPESGATGALQFMPGTWETGCGDKLGCKNAAIEKGVRPPGYQPNMCNLLDAAYAAAKKLAYDVTTISPKEGWYVCGDGGSELADPVTKTCLVPITVPTDCGWTQQNIYHAAAHYQGACTSDYCRRAYYDYYIPMQCS